MNALAVMLVAATVAVDYGWTNRDEGGVEYIIQIEPQVAEALRSGDLPDGVSSVVMPEVQNVRAFRIVIGDEDLPRDEVPLVQAADKPIDGGQPAPNMLAADTAPSLGSRYQNPRYADPVAGPSATIRANPPLGTTGQAIENAGSQFSNEATRLGQGVESAIRNGSQDVANTLRNGLQQAQTNLGLNPATSVNPPVEPPVEPPPYNSMTNDSGRFSTQFGNGATNPPGVNGGTQPSQLVEPPPYSTTSNQNWGAQPNQHLQPSSQWPEANPTVAPPANPNPAAYNSGPPTRAWTNFQQNPQPATTTTAGQSPYGATGNQNVGNQYQNTQYQNPATTSQNQGNPYQNSWQTQQQPNGPVGQPGYQQGPLNNQPNNQLQAPPLQQPLPYTGSPYLASNPSPIQPPANQQGTVPVQPVGTNDATAQSQPVQPSGSNNQPQASIKQPNTSNAGNEEQTAGNTPAGSNRQAPVRSAPDPDSFQWFIMVLLLFSASGNVVLWYLMSNFKQQSQKIAMQLRRARAV